MIVEAHKSYFCSRIRMNEQCGKPVVLTASWRGSGRENVIVGLANG